MTAQVPFYYATYEPVQVTLEYAERSAAVAVESVGERNELLNLHMEGVAQPVTLTADEARQLVVVVCKWLWSERRERVFEDAS